MAPRRFGIGFAIALTLTLVSVLVWRFRHGTLPPWTARQAAAHIAELRLPPSRVLLYDPQWTIGNTDTAIDVVLEFERASFDGLAVRAVATEGYRPLPPDDHNMAIVQSVTGGARDVVYRLWRVGDSGSWRIGILDLQRRRLYATKVDVSY